MRWLALLQHASVFGDRSNLSTFGKLQTSATVLFIRSQNFATFQKLECAKHVTSCSQESFRDAPVTPLT